MFLQLFVIVVEGITVGVCFLLVIFKFVFMLYYKDITLILCKFRKIKTKVF